MTCVFCGGSDHAIITSAGEQINTCTEEVDWPDDLADCGF